MRFACAIASLLFVLSAAVETTVDAAEKFPYTSRISRAIPRPI